MRYYFVDLGKDYAESTARQKAGGKDELQKKIELGEVLVRGTEQEALSLDEVKDNEITDSESNTETLELNEEETASAVSDAEEVSVQKYLFKDGNEYSEEEFLSVPVHSPRYFRACLAVGELKEVKK